MTDEELDQASRVAERELRTLRDTLLEGYVRTAPESLDALTPEERHQVYGMLRMRVVVRMNGTLEASGTFGGGPVFAVRKRGTRSHRDQKVRR